MTRPRAPAAGVVSKILKASGEKFSDFLEHEPWLEWTHWKPDWCLLNEKNQLVPHQVIEPETLMPDTIRILFPATVDAGKYSTLRIARNPGAAGAMFVNFILGMVLIESIAIYGLVIAIMLQGKI